MVQKWRNDKSIPLVDVVDGFQIFVTQTGILPFLPKNASFFYFTYHSLFIFSCIIGGNTGVHIHPDRATLDNEFGFHDDTRVVEHILTHGELKGPHVSDALAKDNRTLSRA